MSVLGVIAAGAAGIVTGGNPQAMMLAYSVGSGVESIVNPPKIEGPRLDELEMQMSNFGSPIPFEYGTNRHAGTVIWPKIIELKEHEHSESAKGGPEITSYTYTVTMAVLICEGPIAGVRRIWANKKLVYDISTGVGRQLDGHGPVPSVPEGSILGPILVSAGVMDPAIGTVRFHLGTEDQEPDPLIVAMDGPSPAYKGYAYVVFEDYDLSDSINRPPQFEFEVITNGNGDIPASSIFGERFDPVYGSVFSSTMDTDTGHVWVATQTGHAVLDPETGKYVVDMTAPSTPQIHEYDPETKELLRVIPIPMNGQNYYHAQGAMVYANGYLFIGAGAPDLLVTSYCLTVNTSTGAIGTITRPPCFKISAAGYWPTVPIPLIDNNGLYMAGGSGVSGGVAPGFMPASSAGVSEALYDATPDRSAPTAPKWNLPIGAWSGRRHSVMQPPTQPPQNLECEAAPLTQFALQGGAISAFVLDNPAAVVVQGANPGGGSYVTWISHSTQVASFNIDPPAHINSVVLPGSPSIMPPVAWDAKNGVLWAFAGEDTNNTLYSMTPGPGSLTLADTGFSFPAVDGQASANDVKGIAVDPETGIMGLMLGGGITPARLVRFNPITQTILQEVPVDATVSDRTGQMWVYPKQNKVVFANGYALHDIPYGNTLDAEPVQLGAIVADLCKRAGLENDEIDVSQLTDMVDGYCVPRQMSARAAIEPLQTAFFFDAVESDDKLKFVKRAASAPILIPMEDRAARDFGSDLPDSLSIVRAQDMELPVQVDVEYADIDADHLVGNQYERRITRDTKQRINIQSPVVMTAAKAKEVAVVTLYRAWLNQTYRFTTTRKWAHLEPTDLVTLPTNEASYTARITSKREQPGGVIEWEAAMESVEVYTQPVTGAAPTNYVKQTIYSPGSTILQLLDIPMLRDADNNGGAYVAMAGTADGWKGAQLFKSSDGGSTYESVLTQSSEAAIGFAQSALPDFTGGNIFDAGSSVTVYMTSGQPLTSATEDQVLNGANLAVIGQPGRWEVTQFKNATLIAANTYQLSGFLRGRRGSEWATGKHAVGDVFILASVATWSRLEAEDLGLPRLYKAPPFRIALSASSSQSFTNTAVSLKPFAPVNLSGVRDGSGNLTLSWLRRTRLASNTLHLPTPLGEASEAYSIDILVGGAVVRTLTSSTPSVVYSAADQAADGIAPGAAVTVSISQMSATVGKGYPLEGTV